MRTQKQWIVIRKPQSTLKFFFCDTLRKNGSVKSAQPIQYFLFYAYFGSLRKSLDDSRVFRLLAQFLIELIF